MQIKLSSLSTDEVVQIRHEFRDFLCEMDVKINCSSSTNVEKELELREYVGTTVSVSLASVKKTPNFDHFRPQLDQKSSARRK